MENFVSTPKQVATARGHSEVRRPEPLNSARAGRPWSAPRRREPGRLAAEPYHPGMERSAATPYSELTPDTVLNAIDSTGIVTDGRLLALNSYENRVFQIGVDDGSFVVAKFYRPSRWSDDQILEEHAFIAELEAHEVSRGACDRNRRQHPACL
jgi:hypothetical protein